MYDEFFLQGRDEEEYLGASPNEEVGEEDEEEPEDDDDPEEMSSEL